MPSIQWWLARLAKFHATDASGLVTVTQMNPIWVAFSVPQDQEVQVRALRAGAAGFLSKNASMDSILRALRSVAGGEAAVTRSLTSHLVELLRSTTENGIGMRPVPLDAIGREPR